MMNWDQLRELGDKSKRSNDRHNELQAGLDAATNAIKTSAEAGSLMDVHRLALVLAAAHVKSQTGQGRHFSLEKVHATRDSLVLPVLKNGILANSAATTALRFLNSGGTIDLKAEIEATGTIPPGAAVEPETFSRWHSKSPSLILPDWLKDSLDALDISTVSGMTKIRDSLLIITAALAKEAEIEIGRHGALKQIADATQRFGYALDDGAIKRALDGLPDALARRKRS